VHTALDLIGILTFAISGALLAIQRDFDIVGIAILAVITALGGGILRDLALGDTPPLAFARWEYLAVPLAAAALTFVAHPALARRTPALLVFDAAGLGVFVVAGTVKALEFGLAPIAAVTRSSTSTSPRSACSSPSPCSAGASLPFAGTGTGRAQCGGPRGSRGQRAFAVNLAPPRQL